MAAQVSISALALLMDRILLSPWVHIVGRRRNRGRKINSWKRQMLEDGLWGACTTCGYGAFLAPGGSGTWFFIRIRKCVITVCHWRYFFSVGTRKPRVGWVAFPAREAVSAVHWLTSSNASPEMGGSSRGVERRLLWNGGVLCMVLKLGKLLSCQWWLKIGFQQKLSCTA